MVYGKGSLGVLQLAAGRGVYLEEGSAVSSCFFPDRVPIHRRLEKAGQLQEVSKAASIPTASSAVNPTRVAGMETGTVGSPRPGVHQIATW